MQFFNQANLVFLVFFILGYSLNLYGAQEVINGTNQEIADMSRAEGLHAKPRSSVDPAHQVQQRFAAPLPEFARLSDWTTQSIPKELPPYDEKLEGLISREEYESLRVLIEKLRNKKANRIDEVQEIAFQVNRLLTKLETKEDFHEGFKIMKGAFLDALTKPTENPEFLSALVAYLPGDLPKEAVKNFTEKIEQAKSFSELFGLADLGRQDL